MCATLSSAKSRVAKISHVDDRMGDAHLVPGEGEAEQGGGGEQRQACEQLVAALQLVQRQHHRGDREHQQQRAEAVETLAHRARRAGGQGEAGRQRGERDRRAKRDTRRASRSARTRKPPMIGPSAAAEADQQCVEAEHLRAALFAVEAGDQRRAAAQRQRSADALQHARGKQPAVGGRDRAEHEGGRADRRRRSGRWCGGRRCRRRGRTPASARRRSACRR